MTVLLADPAITTIPTFDSAESLIDVTALGLDYSGTSYTGRFVRMSLGRRLERAQECLPDGVTLLIREGHRSSEEQQRIISRYSSDLLAETPGLDDLALERLTSRFVAPLAVAPHVAGAAVDLTLADAEGTPLWMGTEIDATPEESNGACFFDADIETDARTNRDLLASVLRPQGLVNYPTEWWHWSYGDRYWAYVTEAGSALYGPIA
jgi:D-alanyl-D-alanine dipeptidase